MNQNEALLESLLYCKLHDKYEKLIESAYCVLFKNVQFCEICHRRMCRID